jgi:hypothetical protein
MPGERRAWADKIEDWQAQLYDYELDDAFELAWMELEGDDEP